MSKQKYDLNEDEKIIFKTSCVRHGFGGAYTNILIITNQSVILEKYGLFDNFKGIERFNYTDIKQAIQGKAPNGEQQLELYIGNKVEDFAPRARDENELRVLVMAINDQMSQNAKYYDFKYYQDILKSAKETDRWLELSEKIDREPIESEKIDLAFAGEVAKNMIKSGDLSLKGVTKGINKTSRKRKKKNFFNEIMDELLDEFGIRDIQDGFTEIGNDFRESFGLKPKITHAERKEFERLEQKRKKEEIKQKKAAIMDDKINEQKRLIEEEKNKTNAETQKKESKSLQSVNEQLDTLKKAKEMLDAGILTQEEFEAKKKEILNN